MHIVLRYHFFMILHEDANDSYTDVGVFIIRGEAQEGLLKLDITILSKPLMFAHHQSLQEVDFENRKD